MDDVTQKTLKRALEAPGTKHLVVCDHRSQAVDELKDVAWKVSECRLNYLDMMCELPNGSRLYFMTDTDRNAIMGICFSTIAFLAPVADTKPYLVRLRERGCLEPMYFTKGEE